MSEKCMDTLRCSPSDLRQAMSIHTQKITDACRDQDCIEDLRVYLTEGSQILLDTARNVRVRCAQLLHSCIQVEPMAFDRNRYCVEVTFFYRIEADALVEPAQMVTLVGLAVFSKRAVLCGEESTAHIFTSDNEDHEGSSDGPRAVIEVLDPMVLSYKVREVCDCGCREETCPQIPHCVRCRFGEDLTACADHRRLYVTLGQFSILRLERDAQLVVPVLDYAIPVKECCESDGCCETPCEMFGKIPFPTQQFSPRGCDDPEDKRRQC